MKKIIILNNASLEVHVFNYDENIWDSPEDFISEQFDSRGMPFKDTECSWMLSEEEGELTIVIH